MRTFSKLARFFIICAIVFFVGLVCSIAGIAAGGVDNIEKLANHYDWIQDDPGEVRAESQTVEDFDSIEATGDADVWILGKSVYESAEWQNEQELLPKSKLELLRPNQVIVIAGENMEKPKIAVNGGTLNINSADADLEGISFNLSDKSWDPTILVCVPDETLKSLNTSSQVADVNVRGVSWENATVQMNTGDIIMKAVKSGGLTVDVDTGDAKLQGEFTGTTRATASTGDVEIETVLAKAAHTLDLQTSTGDITIKEPGKEAVEYDEAESRVSEGSGPNKIIAAVSTGDVDITFGSGQGEPDQGETDEEAMEL